METFHPLVQYGMAGIFILALIITVRYLVQRQDRMEKENRERSKSIEDKLTKYLTEDRETLLEVVGNSSQIIKENSQVLSELKQICQNLRK
jgi:hypothetical protein